MAFNDVWRCISTREDSPLWSISSTQLPLSTFILKSTQPKIFISPRNSSDIAKMIPPTRLAVSLALSLGTIAHGYVIRMDARDGPLKSYEVESTNLTASEFIKRGEPVHFRREVDPSKRETPCIADPQTDYYYKIIGDGNPHQNFKIGQVANTLVECPATVATGESHTFSWSIGGGFNPGVDEFDFANIGFSVGEADTKTVTDSFACDENTDMTEICALHYTAVTAVTVEFWSTTKSCDISTDNDLGQGVVYLPNANGIGSVISRGTNFGDRNLIQCRGMAERNVDFFCGPPGGPEFWDDTGYGPFAPKYMNALDPAGCAIPIEAYHW